MSSDGLGGVRGGADPDDGEYRGLPGAFPYAFRASESWLFRSYVVVGGTLAALLALFFALALVRLFGYTASIGGGTVTLSRAFFAVVGLLVVAPILAPVLLVARSRRRGITRKPGYEAGLALAGYAFVCTLYLGAVAAMPETFVVDGETVARPPPSGPLAPVVAALYSLPSLAGLAFPVVGAALIALVHRLRG